MNERIILNLFFFKSKSNVILAKDAEPRLLQQGNPLTHCIYINTLYNTDPQIIVRCINHYTYFSMKMDTFIELSTKNIHLKLC